MSEEHWCQCDSCTQERINEQKRIAELEQEVERLRKCYEEQVLQTTALDRKLAELSGAATKVFLREERIDSLAPVLQEKQ